MTTNAVFRYDLVANTWTTMAPLQTARTSAEVMASPDGGSIFAVMGGDATFFTGVPQAQSVEIYNVAGKQLVLRQPGGDQSGSALWRSGGGQIDGPGWRG